MTKVIEFGPNVEFGDGRTFHVHAVNCQHLRQLPYRRIVPGSDQGGHISDYDSQAEVVEGIYPSDEFDYDPEQDSTYANDITIFPCTGLS